MIFKYLKQILQILSILISSSKVSSETCESINKNVLILTTLNGQIKGSCNNIGINYANKPDSANQILSWLSIPYAKPPINELRFKYPVPIKSWNSLLDGTVMPNPCIQAIGEGSEDCLYLNIYTPFNSYNKSVIQKNNTANLPIFVWIHGGAFSSGSNSEYDGSRLAAMSNIIVVIINYRLGTFGFLHIKGTDAKGNLALLDQNLALKWINENSDKFGGDRSRITIGGESAGSWSIGYHLIFKSSWPYFRNAILQSGNPVRLDLDTSLYTSDEATLKSNSIGTKLGCNQTNNQGLLNCLQSIDAKYLNLVAGSFLKYPSFVLDSYVFNQMPQKLFESGNFKRCSILTGYNTIEISNEETQSLTYGNMSTLKQVLKKRLEINDNIIDKIIQLYIPSNNMNDYTINYFVYYIKVITDYQYKCPAFQLAEYFVKYNLNAFVYHYGHRISGSTFAPIDGATHADEIVMMFGNILSPEESVYTDDERMLSEQMVKYWSNFIINENPSANNEWKKYYERLGFLFNRNVHSLRATSIANTNVLTTETICKFWNSLVLRY